MKKLSYLFLVILLPAFILAACSDSEKGEEGEKQIELPDQSEQTQQAYADDETTGGFTFTARAAWTATVSELTRASSVQWLRLLHNGEEKYNGEAGTFTIAIELDPNYTGETRSATIVIKSGNDTITITVKQEGKTKEGEIPVEPEEPRLRVVASITETASFFSDFYSTENWREYDPYYYEFKYDPAGRLTQYYIRRDSDNSIYDNISLSYDTDGEIRITRNYEGIVDVASLNPSGYVSKFVELFEGSEGRSVEIEYDAAGYPVKATGGVSIYPDPTVYTIKWSGGNMTAFHDNHGDGEDVTPLFSSELNDKVNLDLNAFFFGFLDGSDLYAAPSDSTVNILAVAGRLGKRSNNYMTAKGNNRYATASTGYDGIYTAASEPETGTVLSTSYGWNFHGEGSYAFDTIGCPVSFTHQVRVDKIEHIYKGGRIAAEPSEWEVQDWLEWYGPGPYFRIRNEEEITTFYDTYTYHISYAD